jgi:hypothetical protein
MLYDSVINCKLVARDSGGILELSQRGKRVVISILEIPGLYRYPTCDCKVSKQGSIPC